MLGPGIVYSFLFVSLATVALVTVLLRMTRGITFYGIGTDNQIQVRTAARAAQWRWPSDMHTYGSGKTRMKDVFIIALAVVQRLLGDRETDDSTVALCILANGLSAVLIFLLGVSYWNIQIGILVFLLFVTSCWPSQVALFGGHICVAQTFFLAAAIALVGAERSSFPYSLGCYGASGVATGLMMFTSASSRKFLPFVAGAFFYSARGYLDPRWRNVGMLQGIDLIVLMAAALLIGVTCLFWLTYKRVVTAAYFEKGPKWLNNVVKAREQLGLEIYLNRAHVAVRLLCGLCLASALYLLACILVFPSAEFQLSQIGFFLGFFVVLVTLTYPNPLENILGYFSYWNAPRDRGHFKLYKDYFSKIGSPIDERMRGAGMKWIFRFFWRIAPFHFCFYLISMAAILLKSWTNLELVSALAAFGIILLSLSPVLVGEITRGPQLGRSYFPSFIGMLLLTGYAVFQLEQEMESSAKIVLWLVIGTGWLGSALWNIYVFVSDIWPARMAVTWLGRTLQQLKVKKLYTYDTPYNDSFANALPQKLAQKLEIVPITSLADLEEGYVAVPGTSAKALNMESCRLAIDNGDFREDPFLNRIIDSRTISRCAVAAFKTFGTSRIWTHESDVASYRDLILREVTDEDRWRGYAWIIDAKKAHECLSFSNVGPRPEIRMQAVEGEA